MFSRRRNIVRFLLFVILCAPSPLAQAADKLVALYSSHAVPYVDAVGCRRAGSAQKIRYRF